MDATERRWLLLLTMAMALAGCAYDGRGTVAEYWPVTIDNQTGITLEVWLDGVHRATVTSGTFTTIPEVREGNHTLEAFDLDGEPRARRSFFLAQEFVWVLE